MDGRHPDLVGTIPRGRRLVGARLRRIRLLGGLRIQRVGRAQPALPFLPEQNIPHTEVAWSKALRAVVFCDGAKTFLKGRTSPGTVKDKFLLGLGFGFRFDPSQYFSLRCDLGFPVGDESTDARDPRIHVFVRGGF